MRERRRSLILVVALVAATVVLPGTASAQEALGAYGVPLRFEADAGVTFEVEGVGRYVDTLVGRLAPDGELVLINDVTIDEYVMGIAEMPARWPIEALKAQAVAARTYAWHQMQLGTFAPRGYDICPSTACQVFAGREVVETPGIGDRWRQAVEATAGEVIQHEGEPILARYFSTSGGSTRNNEHVFPSEGPRPYLKAVEDPADDVSPLHEWQVRFERADFDTLLSEGETLSTAVPVAAIELVPAQQTGRTDVVRVTGRNGQVAEVSASAFRAFVSEQAPEAFPDKYPSDRPDGRPLPAALPSSRVSFELTEDELVISGRGWGHGVGMSQWGANGLAEEGADYREILRHYYTGVDVTASPPDLPSRMRVGLDARSSSGESFRVSADGPFRVLAGDAVITDRALGSWEIVLRDDRSIGLRAPTGYGAPLVVSPTETTRTEPTEVEVVTLETVVNKATELRLSVTDAEGAVVLERDLGIAEAGRHEASWSLDDTDGLPVTAGRYQVVLTATDEESVTGGEPVDIDVRALHASASIAALLDERSPRPPSEGGVPIVVLAGLLGLAGGAFAAAVWPLGRRRD